MKAFAHPVNLGMPMYRRFAGSPWKVEASFHIPHCDGEGSFLKTMNNSDAKKKVAKDLVE